MRREPLLTRTFDLAPPNAVTVRPPPVRTMKDLEVGEVAHTSPMALVRHVTGRWYLDADQSIFAVGEEEPRDGALLLRRLDAGFQVTTYTCRHVGFGTTSRPLSWCEVVDVIRDRPVAPPPPPEPPPPAPMRRFCYDDEDE